MDAGPEVRGGAVVSGHRTGRLGAFDLDPEEGRSMGQPGARGEGVVGRYGDPRSGVPVARDRR
jgi:hypothetical protein